MIILIVTFNCFSQKVVVVDSISKKLLPYAAIKFENSGLYTNDIGVFDLSDISGENIEISYLGYKKKVLFVNNIKDTILVKPGLNVLDDVVISNKKKVSSIIKPLKKSSSYGSWVLKPKTELLAVLYPNNDKRISFVEKIAIVFDKVIERRQEKSSLKKINAVFRVNVYNVKDGFPSDLLFSSEPIEVNSYFGGEITLNVSNHVIKLTEGGISIGVEMIGFYDDNKNVVSEGSFIRPALTNKKSSYYNIKTYLSYVFNEKKLQQINEIFSTYNPQKKSINRNLILGLTLSD